MPRFCKLLARMNELCVATRHHRLQPASSLPDRQLPEVAWRGLVPGLARGASEICLSAGQKIAMLSADTALGGSGMAAEPKDGLCALLAGSETSSDG